MGNALVDIMTQLEDDSFLSDHNLPKGSMQLVNFETAEAVLAKAEKLKKQRASGGSAANTIHGLAQLGIECGFLGKIGSDDMGDFFKEDLILAKINPQLLQSEGRSGVAVALVSTDSERTFATYLGAAAEMSPNDMHDKLFHGYDLLHIEGYLVFNQELIEAALKLAKKNNLLVSLDLASYNVVEANLEFLKRVSKEYVDIIFANEEEAKAFTGLEPQEAVVAISELVDIAVVKIGAKGALVKRGNSLHQADAIKVTSIDTTGAGDLFASGFLYGLMHSLDLTTCAKMGAVLGGNVIEVIGAKMDNQRWDSIRKSVEVLKG